MVKSRPSPIYIAFFTLIVAMAAVELYVIPYVLGLDNTEQLIIQIAVLIFASVALVFDTIVLKVLAGGLFAWYGFLHIVDSMLWIAYTPFGWFTCCHGLLLWVGAIGVLIVGIRRFVLLIKLDLETFDD